MKIKEQSGITLTILVLTIVVMLILAGTVIISLSGYGDIKSLKDLANDLEVLREKVEIYYEKNNSLPVGTQVTGDISTLLGQSKNANDGENYYKLDLSKLDNINLIYGVERSANDYFIVNEESHNVYYYAGVEVDGKTYHGIKDVSQVVDEVEFGLETFELKVETDATVVNGELDVQLKVYTDVQNENISKYKFKINDQEWTEEQVEAMYIYHDLNQYETYTVSMIILDNNNNEIYASNNETKVTIKELPVNLTIDGKLEGTYNNPLIPAGFIPLNINDAVWQSSDGYKKGLVIEDAMLDRGTNRSQFVWVPVENYEDFKIGDSYSNGVIQTGLVLNEAGASEGVQNLTGTALEAQQVYNSVKENGGFYVARYEAGINEEMPIPTSDTTSTYANGTYKPVSRGDAQVWNYIAWGGTTASNGTDGYNGNDAQNGAVKVARAMYDNLNFKSNLIYGVQWDAIMRFVSDLTNTNVEPNVPYIQNSTGMGNHTGQYINTGNNALYATKNIYDLAGNVFEWTMENIDTDKRTIRGGSTDDTGFEYAASGRAAYSPTISDAIVGFRVALYML